MTDPVASILDFNAGRDPQRLAMKYANMRTSPFVFLRGACHLFYERLPVSASPKAAPATWVCGDLHLQNFGSYKGDNRLSYFDINDFDEAALAPATWDLVRLMTSVMVAHETMGIRHDQAAGLSSAFLDAYCAALASGRARWVDRDESKGLVRELLDSLRERPRVDYLNRRTTLNRSGRLRSLRLPEANVKQAKPATPPKVLAADPADVDKVRRFMVDFAATQTDPAFFKVLDVARRVAGTGSLGVERYVVLVQGKGSPDRNYLLDLKHALPSSLLPYLASRARRPLRQPEWPSDAHRVVELQRRMQAVSMAFLHPVHLGAKPFVLRALQPSEDRVEFSAPRRSVADLQVLLGSMGQLLAWAQLRSAGRGGSATADQLIAFSGRRKWKGQLTDAVAACESQTRADWDAYRKAYDAGAFAVAATNATNATKGPPLTR